MKVYRITKTKYAEDLRGTGAKLYGGRWNHIDSACIYTAESRALSVLEYAVNINIDFIPRALSLCVFEIDESQVYSFKQEDLPGNWRETPAPKSTKDYGTQFLKGNKPILKIPSIIIPEEFNYIINPRVASLSFKLVEIQDFVFDLRIKKK
ncbi:RES family NAD+ phosphorylase [Aequorivita xiaoshiensis]|uniref:RES family NAD+ phosphorylase n=1 Tax=Aequorivita xiaoshiensis TaxID=2874476 RepID=A0A9X1R2R4_9FLAO|nr:RES family NAD+ phosphorylase [Aequorivita xiaoshiensis]MCG2430732.1 RES family NAD+ phosphorylase [Aequorivita xiaoshiensis]